MSGSQDSNCKLEIAAVPTKVKSQEPAFSQALIDCVDHSILLEVLELQFGITGSALLWIANFLTNRSHLVCLIGTNSSK